MSPLIIPLSGGGEFRVVIDGRSADVQRRTCYPDGHAMLGGALRVSAAELRLLIRACKVALHHLERAEALPPGGVPPGLRCAA